MPIYQYRCPKCQQIFDIIKPFKEMDTNEICPSCLVPSERIIFSPSNFHLKGTGWYKTDYKDNKKEEKK